MAKKYKIRRPAAPGKFDEWHESHEWVSEGEGTFYDSREEAEEVLSFVREDGCKVVEVDVIDDSDDLHD